jgi:UDP:flavonoid glycosyltransferase YjiC (YdhE family)
MLISAGNLANEVDQSAVPQNARVVSFAPALDVLKTTKLLISQAGANLTKEAIFHGVPMLVLPDRGDQPGNAARVVYHKLGLAITKPPSMDQLESFASRLLHDPTASAGLHKMQDAFYRHDSNDELILQALDAVEGGKRNISEVNRNLSSNLAGAFGES